MTSAELHKLVEAHPYRLGGPTVRALHLILVEHKTWKQAASETGVYESTIARAMRSIKRDGIDTSSPVCPHCGRPYHH